MKPTPSEQAVFAEALLRDTPEARTAYLDAACGAETALRERVEALLRAAGNAGTFLEEPPEGLSAGEESALALNQLSEKPGDKIGRYKLLQQIGEGGCGVVYMAEQEEPVRRRVALKVIKLGMDTKNVIARFEAERQALALMDHPNIARVLDAGATTTGRPYFVMELVRGVKITEYCDQNNLSTEVRLNLFTQVCHAIQHAHQKGIIHRDIKPSNILVTVSEPGAPGCPKVIDFGIAKATTDQRLTDKTVFTAFEQFIGTPAYMSPEQAMLTSLDIDTRTDIYALGVLLYELLTGTTPFDAKDLMSAGLHAMRRIIHEQEPERPSTRLSTMLEADLTTVAKHRHSEPAKLGPLLRGDLDWIVMKALEKDRTRRYETANGLAADIRRHLQSEPVVARPPTNLYRFQKLVRRNKLAFAAVSAVAAALVLGLCVATWALVRERTARTRAEDAQRKAKIEASKSQQVAQFMKDMLNGVGPGVARGRDATLLREILDQTSQRLNKDLADQPEVEADLRETLGVVYCEIGLYTNAQATLEEALRLRKQLHGSEDLSVASALHNLAEVFRQLRRNVDAEAAYREALAIRRKLSGNENADAAASLFGLAEVIRRKETARAYSEAEATHREALAIRRKLLGNEDPAVANSLTGLGIVLGKGHLPEAEACLREALDIQRKRFGAEHTEMANTLCNLGLTLAHRGKLAEAEEVLREAVAMQKKLVGEHRDTAYALNFLGDVLQKRGRPADAEQAHREALAMQRKVLGEHTDLSVSLAYLATTLVAQGRLADAEAAHREALALRRKLVGDEHSNTGDSRLALAYLLWSQKRFPEVEPLFREHLAIVEKNRPDDWATFNTRSMLGKILQEQKKYDEAELLLLSGYEGMKQRERKIPASNKPPLKEALQRIAQLYEATGQSEKAADWNRKLADFK